MAYGHREILLFICKSFSMLSIWTSKSASFHSTPQPGLYHYCSNHTLDAPESSFTFKLSPYILWLQACPPNKTNFRLLNQSFTHIIIKLCPLFILVFFQYPKSVPFNKYMMINKLVRIAECLSCA